MACAHCAQQFTPQLAHPSYRFCSPRCSADWWNAARRSTRACTHCAADMAGWPRNARVCSDSCRTDRKRQVQKQADARRRVPIGPGTGTCQQCGDQFDTQRPSVAAFCSAWCQQTSRSYQDGTSDRWAMWNGTCYVCSEPADATDHVKPRAAGGLNLAANLRPICTRCNSVKRARWLGIERLGELIDQVRTRSMELAAA